MNGVLWSIHVYSCATYAGIMCGDVESCVMTWNHILVTSSQIDAIMVVLLSNMAILHWIKMKCGRQNHTLDTVQVRLRSILYPFMISHDIRKSEPKSMFCFDSHL